MNLNKPQGSHKKAYQKPILRVYGDVLKLTGVVNVAGANTDGMFGKLKSQ